MSGPTLFIGNRVYSSWSMRPWLALSWAGIDFETRLIPLGPRGGGLNPDIVAVNPAGTVPVLHVEGELVSDSLAICEWAAEQAPHLWPADAMARALARSAACEMHSGFAAVRQTFPMNLRRTGIPLKSSPSEAAMAQVARIDALWSSLRARFGSDGPYLFGQRSIADAMFTPVATRFRSYGVALSPVAQAVCDTMLTDDAFRAWEAAATEEAWVIGETDGV